MSHTCRVYEPEMAYFITSTIVHWIPVFSRGDYFQVLADSLSYCAENKGLAIHCYAIMPNHFHAICSHSEGRLSDVMRDLKKHTSKKIAPLIEQSGRHGWIAAMRKAASEPGGFRVWDDAFYPEQVHSQVFYEEKLAYIHNNPVKAGFVNDPSDWKYSSAGFYYRETESVVPVTPVMW